jgi:hypothetical protein
MPDYYQSYLSATAGTNSSLEYLNPQKPIKKPCPYCGRAMKDNEIMGVNGKIYCSRCVRPCPEPGCSGMVVGDRRFVCDKHQPQGICWSCQEFKHGDMVDTRCRYIFTPPRDGRRGPMIFTGFKQSPLAQTNPRSEPKKVTCKVCSDNGLCPLCKRRPIEVEMDVDAFGIVLGPEETDWVAAWGVAPYKVCSSCSRRHGKAEMPSDIEEFAEDVILPGKFIISRTLRPARPMGIEIEGMGSETKLAEALYAAKLSQYDHRVNNGDHGGFCHLQYDGSVDWELVIHKFFPHKFEHMNKVHDVMNILRRLRKDKIVWPGYEAGTHIHVSARKYSAEDAKNLYNLACYLEDPLYRIAASGWPAHRICSVTHGLQNGAAAPMVKEERFDEIDTFVNTVTGLGRYYGLNFANWSSNSRNYCKCGAMTSPNRRRGYDDFGNSQPPPPTPTKNYKKRCTCPESAFGKNTFEFRVFNSTFDTTRLHGFMALSHALVTYAQHEEFSPKTHPPMTFNMLPLKKCTKAQKTEIESEWKPRLNLMLKTLPLSNTERQSLLYCISTSDMKEIEL